MPLAAGKHWHRSQVKAGQVLRGWPYASIVGAISMPSTHLVKEHRVTNRQVQIQEERNRAYMCTNSSCLETSEENVCKWELNKCIQETRSMGDKL